MSDPAIIVEGLSKRYRLGTGAHHYGRLTESLSNAMSAPFRRLLGRPHPGGPEHIWALKDIDFRLEHGDTLGVIGRNGAGKTTLLKILSRITEPTTGRVRLNGRVGSLLEVGTGFHPELTGRENVFLNGAILGMSRSQINRRFDEIVEFAGVGPFMETPVKRYSSGMQVRLAFAVAAHLEPEILIVDEVLAVGDVAFQRKCLGKMGDVAQEGRTVLFVSHNMSLVSRLCEQGLWLENGQVAGQGPMEGIVRQYLSSSAEHAAEFSVSNPHEAPGNDVIRLRAVRIRDHDGHAASAFDARKPIHVEIEYAILRRSPVRTAFKLTTAEGITLFTSTDADDEQRYGKERDPGLYLSRCEIPPQLLKRGLYFVSVSSSIPMVKVNFAVDNIVTFSIDQIDAILDNRVGVFTPALHWNVESITKHEDASSLDSDWSPLHSTRGHG